MAAKLSENTYLLFRSGVPSAATSKYILPSVSKQCFSMKSSVSFAASSHSGFFSILLYAYEQMKAKRPWNQTDLVVSINWPLRATQVYMHRVLCQDHLQPEWHDVMGEIFFVVLGPIFSVSFYRHKDGFRICCNGQRSWWLPVQLHACFFFVCHILERSTVLTQIQSDELHDSFTTYDIAAVMANHVDYILREVLQFACLFDVTSFPASMMPTRLIPL